MEDDVERPPRTLRGWLIAGGVNVLMFVVLVLILYIWWSWTDALTWALVGLAGWVGADIYSEVRRRRRRREGL